MMAKVSCTYLPLVTGVALLLHAGDLGFGRPRMPEESGYIQLVANHETINPLAQCWVLKLRDIPRRRVWSVALRSTGWSGASEAFVCHNYQLGLACLGIRLCACEHSW